MSSPEKIKVAIAEDHELTRLGLKLELEETGLIEVVGEAENGQQAIELLNECMPDVVLMDICMPEIDGITATKRLKELNGSVKVAMLTSIKEPKEVLGSLTAGAHAFCTKEITIPNLIQVIRFVKDGALWIDPAVAGLILTEFSKISFQEEDSSVLTLKEVEVLRYIAAGKEDSIAQAFESAEDFQAIVKSILKKLSVDSKAKAAAKALQEGLLNQSGLVALNVFQAQQGVKLNPLSDKQNSL